MTRHISKMKWCDDERCVSCIDPNIKLTLNKYFVDDEWLFDYYSVTRAKVDYSQYIYRHTKYYRDYESDDEYDSYDNLNNFAYAEEENDSYDVSDDEAYIDEEFNDALLLLNNKFLCT